MDFHGRVTKLLEIYSIMDARVENIKKKFLNNFKILKTTFNCLILIIFVIFCFLLLLFLLTSQSPFALKFASGVNGGDGRVFEFAPSILWCGDAWSFVRSSPLDCYVG